MNGFPGAPVHQVFAVSLQNNSNKIPFSFTDIQGTSEKEATNQNSHKTSQKH